MTGEVNCIEVYGSVGMLKVRALPSVRTQVDMGQEGGHHRGDRVGAVPE